MKPAFAFALMMALAALPSASADVGPGPVAPEIVVRMTEGGAPAASVKEITYHCMGTDVSDPQDIVSPHTAVLPCSGGACTNSGGWYYKYNPCFAFPYGHFTYEYDGEIVRSGEFNTTSGAGRYVLSIDAPTGQISREAAGGACPAGFALLAAALAVQFLRR